MILPASSVSRPDTPASARPGDTLTIVTRRSPTTYFEDERGPNGYEYLLARSLAETLHKKLDIIVVETLDDVFKTLESGQADLAAAGLSVTPERSQHFRFTQPYMEVRQLVLYRSQAKRPRNLDALQKLNIVVQAGSSHAERLNQLRSTHPDLQWSEQTGVTAEDLIRKVEAGEFDATLVDSNKFYVLHGRLDSVDIAFELPEPERLAWAFPPGADEALIRSTEEFLTQAKASGDLDYLSEIVYGHFYESFKEGMDTRSFAEAMDKKLPKYRQLMRDVADSLSIDWRLVAAIAYQESEWSPQATSPTGVRGMMMLTERTAEELGVTNRLDPRQSLRGGALYLQKIYAKIPDTVNEPDRTWLALAAYNVGWAPVKSAMRLTEKQGDDPSRWINVKERLPLIEKASRNDNRIGYVRGRQAVEYVQRIRHYYELLAWQFPNSDTPLVERVATL